MEVKLENSSFQSFFFMKDPAMPLRQKIFILLTFFAMIIVLVGLIANILLDMNVWTTLLTLIALAITFVFFRLSQSYKDYKKLITPFTIICLVLIPTAWFVNAGWNSNIISLMFVVFTGLYTISDRKYRSTVFATLFTMMISLMTVQHYYPELIIPYADNHQRFVDLMLGNSVYFIFLYYIIELFISSYVDENAKVYQVNSELMLKNQTIRESEERYHAMMETSTDGIHILDEKGYLVEANAAFLEQIGYTREEIAGLHISDWNTEWVNKPSIPSIEQLLESANRYSAAHRSRSGRIVHVDVSTKGIVLNNKQYVHCSARDITEQVKQNELIAIQSHALQAAQNGIIITQSDGKIEWVNTAYEKMTGYTLQEAIGKDPAELVRTDAQTPEFFEDMWATIRSGKPWEGEITNRRKDGTRYIEEQTITPIFDDAGTIIHFIGIKLDITKRKTEEQHRFFIENQLRGFYEQSSVGMVVTGLDSTFQKVNRKFCEMIGYSESELLTMSYSDITHPDDTEVHESPVKMLLTGERLSFTLEKRYLRKDKTTVWVKISVSLILDENDVPLHFATVVEDVTQRRAIETAVQNLAVLSKMDDKLNSFDVIVQNFADAVNADSAIMGILTEDKKSILTLAVVHRGLKLPNSVYAISGTACERTINDGYFYIPDRMNELFRCEILPVHREMRSYLGTTLVNASGEVIGLLAAMGQQPLDTIQQFRTIHSLFAERAANELVSLEAETMLQKSEEQYRFLVERSQDVVVRMNLRGVVTYCSPAITILGGYDPDTVKGQSFKNFFVHRSEMLAGFTSMKAAVIKGLPSRYEFQFRTNSGAAVWVESVGKAVSYNDGTFELQTIIRDISERKKSEEVLVLYKEIISATGDSISLVDDQFRYLVVNDAYLRRMGKKREEIEMHSIAEIFGKDVFEKTIKANFERCLGGEEVHYQAWFNFAGVGRKFMDVQYAPYNHQSRRGVLVSSRDITALKDAQNSKIESENRFKAVWENSHDAMRLTNAEGIVVMVNDAYCALMKKDMNQLVGNAFTVVYPQKSPADSLANYRTRFETRTVEEYFERDITLWNNETLYIQASNTFLTLPDNEVLLLSAFKDISIRVHALEDLKDSEQRYRGIIESSMDGFWTVDYSGKILQVNEAYCRMSGYSKEELLSMHVSEIEANENPAETERHMKIIVADGRDKFESKHRAKDGTFFDVEISTVVLTDLQVLVVFIGDITERKTSELALKESERRFRGILEDVTLISIILDSNGHIVMANNFLLNLTGYAREDVLGKSWFDMFIPAEIRSELHVTFEGGMVGKGLPQHYENEILKRSGERLIIRWTNIFLYDNSNAFAGITSIGEDITERRRMQSVLRDREEQYRTLITTMQQGMSLHEIILSPEGIPVDYRFIDINESFEQLTGLKASEVIGKTVLEVMPETEQYWIEQYGAVALTGAPLFYENYSKVLNKYFEVIAYRPKPNHFATIVSDITQRKLSEQKVLDNERQYRLLAENSTDVIWTMDFEGRFKYVSPSVTRLRGFTPEEVMLQPLDQVICPSSTDIVVTGLLRAVEYANQGLDIPHEYFLVEQPRKDGTTVWTEVITRILYDENRKALGILGVTRDITERKRNEDLLQTRLLLSEYANGHTVKELLQKILDEAEKITESTIGFFHFVENDQRTIALQTWSTNTLTNMCHAEGDGHHYPVEQAGVWVECIYTKAPVVHNAFSVLPNRKGLPEGHSPIVRELLIPILRNDLVVGIMGIGNKQFNYDSKDIEIAAQLATMAWDILERRRAELSLFSHEQALEGLSNAALSLLNMNEQNLPIMVWAALESLGKGLNVDRIVIFQHTYNANAAIESSSLKYEWANDPLHAMIDHPGMQDANFTNILPTMYRALNEGKIFSGVVDELPDEERKIFQGNNVKSIMSIPIFIESRFWGSLSIDSINEVRQWSKDDESILRVAAESIGVALHRMSAISSLYENEQMLKFALDASGDGIWTFTIPDNQVYFSNELKKLVKFEHMSSENNFEFWVDHVHPEDRSEALEAMDRHLKGEDPIFANEHRFLCGDGQYRWMLDRGKVLRWNKDGSPLQIFGTYSDIHLRKETEQKIIELNEQLEQKVEDRTKQLRESVMELESFSYSISHDLRAPVRAIDSFAKILADDEEQKLSDEGKRLLKTIRSNTARMGRMIDDLLQFSRASRAEIKKIHFDMNTLTAKVLDESLDGEKQRFFETVIHPLPAADGDPSLIRQVLVNLVNNAVKFTRGNEIASIEIGGSVKDGECIYFVKDNGVGFDMRYVDKLFGVFQRLHSASEFEGTGVGLAIVNRILQKHSGRIWVESVVSVGTTFYFSIPAENKTTQSNE